MSNSVRRIGGSPRDLAERSAGSRSETSRRTNGNPTAFLLLPGWITGRHQKNVLAGGSSPVRKGRVPFPLERCERKEGSKGVSVYVIVLQDDLLADPRYSDHPDAC
ncbi:hypothetical protein T07_6923 [Trichinella nelsoni]|uniref:Uncharacterized protein n=1 Tax=Trichinella nelsoni TaxID=6336 RepID=A0A0V0S1T2_9BILA|nr:hypothetical protein T07_6923 [Trichinella nelsoni]